MEVPKSKNMTIQLEYRTTFIGSELETFIADKECESQEHISNPH
jgi:hypothetical protein